MISKAYAEKVGDPGLAKTLIGTGPLKFDEWVTGVHLKLVKNDSYWEKGTTAIPCLTLTASWSRQSESSVAGIDPTGVAAVLDLATENNQPLPPCSIGYNKCRSSI